MRDGEVLLVTDVQNDFCPGGRLAVPGGDEVVPVINRLASRFRHVVLTQDWHPEDHTSFASSHPGKAPFSEIEMPYGPQTLWPDHCTWESEGAAFHADLDIPQAQLVIRKGYHKEIDSYSAFFENDRTTPTGLSGYLRERGLTRIVCVGLAFDYCVRYSAEDAVAHGFDTIVIEEACRAIDLAGSAAATKASFRDRGIKLR
ncbi:bifunctional nicotinamidase/pyrazinamidase [Taklimakanibacter deserti]|uniref:bifunctional nicotinamidase/pyrazinamidase n=1 Tax=Taklimakanibacter deserti TaxID=2267839 RepID=UPI000E64CAB4